MSIEDVDYMKENSIKENYTFIVDSKFRDQEEYPEPNNYVINFDIPFKNVFGIEVLDVSIPKTMYNIDKNSNKLYIYINTLKNPIINYYDMTKGFEWEVSEKDQHSSQYEIVNYTLSDDLLISTNISDIFKYKISNLNKYNYIKVIDISKWTRKEIGSVSEVDNDLYQNRTIFNPGLSEDLKLENTADDDYKTSAYIINKLRSYNIIPIIDNSADADFYLHWYNVGSVAPDNNYGFIWEYIGEQEPENGNKLTDTIMINKLELLTTEEDLELSPEEFNLLNINKDDIINKNNYFRIASETSYKYYKPKTNLDIGVNWIFTPNILSTNKYYNMPAPFEAAMRNKIIDNNSLNFTNIELNNLSYDFNNNINTYIRITTGLKWIKIPWHSVPDEYPRLQNENLQNYINYSPTNNGEIQIDTAAIDDELKEVIRAITSPSYIEIENQYWITSDTTYIVNPRCLVTDKLLWLTNENLDKLINPDPETNTTYKNKYNEIHIRKDEWESTGINKDDLLSDTLILVDNQYYKIIPSYYYAPKINYYYPIPNDNLNINNIEDYNELLRMFFELFIIEIPIGNYTLNKLIVAINTEFRNNINLKILNRTTEDDKVDSDKFLIDTDNFELELNCNGNTTPVEIQNILKFEANRHIILDMNNSTLNKTLGFYSKVSDKSEYINNYTYLNINKIINYEKIFHSYKYQSKYKIIAPGIIYLIGSEYIILKCPEIEEHLYGSLSYTKNTLGLAKIRVSNWGLNEESTSYLKLKLREFHPIGKLSKITLQFNNSDGTLYDFRGVNHNIVFAIYYYSPKQKQKFVKSIINPEYKMNFIEYRYLQEEQDAESDIENDNNLDINIDNYKRMEEKYSKKEFDNGYELDYNIIREKFYNNLENE